MFSNLWKSLILFCISILLCLMIVSGQLLLGRVIDIDGMDKFNIGLD
jgi:hypothetical protein